MNRLNLLWVSSICPYPPSGGNHQRNYYLLRGLASRHRVTLVCPVRPGWDETPEGLRDFCEAVVAVPDDAPPSGRFQRLKDRLPLVGGGRPGCFVPRPLDEMGRVVAGLGEREPFDVAFGGLYVAPVVIAARAACRVLDDQNVEAELYGRLWRGEALGLRKLARMHDCWLVSRFERSWLARADAVTVCSERDRDLLTRLVPGLPRTVVVPNGVDLDTVPFSEAGRGAETLIMVGGMSYRPNVDGAVFLVREVMPRVWAARSGVRLLLVGSRPAAEVRALAGPKVEVTGTVPDVRPYLDRASLEVVPLRSGGGTRFKIVEAMAAGVPIVSTSAGAEGLGLRHGKEVWIADTAEGIASAVLRFLDDPPAAGRMAKAARARAEADYGWKAIGEGFDSFLRSCLERKTGQYAAR